MLLAPAAFSSHLPPFPPFIFISLRRNDWKQTHPECGNIYNATLDLIAVLAACKLNPQGIFIICSTCVHHDTHVLGIKMFSTLSALCKQKWFFRLQQRNMKLCRFLSISHLDTFTQNKHANIWRSTNQSTNQPQFRISQFSLNWVWSLIGKSITHLSLFVKGLRTITLIIYTWFNSMFIIICFLIEIKLNVKNMFVA